MSRRLAARMQMIQRSEPKEWSEREVQEFNKRAHPDSIAKRKARTRMIKKYGFVSSAIVQNPKVPQLNYWYYVTDDKGRCLCIETAYKLNMMIGFVESEAADAWAAKIPRGKVKSTAEFTDGVINGANVKDQDTNLNELINPIAAYFVRKK